MKNESKIRKLSLKYRYLLAELQDVRETYEEYYDLFTARVMSLEEQHKTLIIKRVSNNNIKDTIDSTDITETDDRHGVPTRERVFKDMYSQIAVKTHPDKNGGDEDLTRIFRQAAKANKSGDLVAIVNICSDLEIPLPPLRKKHVKIMEENILDVQNEIDGVTKQDAYIWGEADEDRRAVLEESLVKSGVPMDKSEDL
jgi:hypothetical protein